jgi:hypothetical protein
MLALRDAEVQTLRSWGRRVERALPDAERAGFQAAWSSATSDWRDDDEPPFAATVFWAPFMVLGWPV